MYIRTNSGMGIVRRGMGATAPSPYPYCDPNYPGACDNSKTPWASQFARDPNYPYPAGGEFGKVSIPVWAAVQAIGNDGQTSNPVRNLFHLVPSVGDGLTRVFLDLDGYPIEPAALIAKAVDAAAKGEYFPWSPDIKPDPYVASGQVKTTPRTFPGWNFYNDNIRPGTQFSSPAQMRAAALSSGSRSTGMPPNSIGPEGNNDANVQRYWTFKALADVPLERLPEAAMPFWRQSSYGLPKGQTVGGPGFPPVCPNNPMTGVPDPDCVAMLAANPQVNTNCGKRYDGTMDWNLYMASQAGCPATPTIAPRPVLIPEPPPPPQVRTIPAPINPGISVMTDPAQNPYTFTTGGPNTPLTYSPGGPGAQPVRTRVPATKQVQPEMIPAAGIQQPQTQIATSGALDSAMAWAKNNPLIVGGIAVAAFFMFSQGKR